MIHTVCFDHKIGDQVHIKAIEMNGIVTGLMSEQDGQTYRVVYWNDGNRKCDWMLGLELEKIKNG